MNYDFVNGLFEAVGAVATWRNFLAIRRDMDVRGVEWTSMAFFAAWGIWNCAFYPAIHQWWSTVGGIALASGNLSWVGLALWLRLRPQASVQGQSVQTTDGQQKTELSGDLGSNTKSISL
jgi:hypothetical protein